MVGFQEDCVLVVLDADRNKQSAVDALDWGIKHIVQPKDTVVVLGLVSEVAKRGASSCFPRQLGIGLSGIWVRLELSTQGELSPKELKEEIERKREIYQSILQPFNRQCKKNEVKLETKLAVGYDPRRITVEEAQTFNPRLIILDSHFRKHRMYIYSHVACEVAVMNGKGGATLMQSKGSVSEQGQSEENNGVNFFNNIEHNSHEGESCNICDNTKCSLSPCRTGFPRALSENELEIMANKFANGKAKLLNGAEIVYEAVYNETPVLVRCYPGNNENAYSLFQILSKVRHRNVMNLVGYCFTADSLSLLCDFPCCGTLEMNLKCDEMAKKLSWKDRWYVALDIGTGIRYLHEECADGPIVGLSITSFGVVLCHSSSALLSLPVTATWLKHASFSNADSSSNDVEDEEHLFPDVYAYGTVLIELISGKSARDFQEQEEGLSLIDWALPLLEEGSLADVMDPRLIDSSDYAMADHILRAALLCLKKDSSPKPTISQVLAAVQGHGFAITIKS